MKVFIGDDAAIVRERLVSLFVDLDRTVDIVQATNAPDSVRAIRTHRPDIVILDLRMPGGGGLDVLKRLSRFKIKPLVIVLTNFPFPQYRKRCLELGADFFLDKSTEFDKIPRLCSRWARRDVQ
jgi:DNA-binding NarL/FixJ family response regulator